MSQLWPRRFQSSGTSLTLTDVLQTAIGRSRRTYIRLLQHFMYQWPPNLHGYELTVEVEVVAGLRTAVGAGFTLFTAGFEGSEFV